MDEKAQTTGKGKGRASNSSKAEDSNELNPRSGLLSRVVDSASGLVRDAAGPANNNTTNALSFNSLLGGKAQSSTSASGTSAWSAAATLRSQPLASGISSATAAHTTEAFRSQAALPADIQDFDQFLSQQSTFHPDLPVERPSSDDWAYEWTLKDPVTGLTAGETQATQTQPRHGRVDLYDDGAEVRALLSDPSFARATDTFPSEPINDAPQPSIDDLFPQTFSAEEQQTVNQIRAALPAPPTHKAVPVDHPLNLRPLSDVEQATIHEDTQNFRPYLKDTASESSKAQRDEWLSDWSGVLNSYSDEVWGDMLPVVREARAQIEEVKAGESSLDNKALARLKMILGHVNEVGSPNPDSIFAQQRESLNEEAEEADNSVPTFHCPWVACHKVSGFTLLSMAMLMNN